MGPIRRFCAVGFAASLLLTGQVAAQTPPSSGGVVINMHDVELADVAEQISRITGRTLVLDPSVKGTVNVVSAAPLSANGVWELFQSVLRVHGFAAVRSGAAWRVVPQAQVVQNGSTVDLRGVVRSQDVVTRLIQLNNLSSETAARVFKPLVASFGNIEALPSPNAIIITDYAENVRRIEQLARALDNGGGPVFDSLSPRYASALDIGKAIQSILGDNGARIAIDERSNTVLLRGDERALAEARRVAAALDIPGGAAPMTRVFRLSHADAETVTDIIRGLVGGQGQATNPVARALAPRNQSQASAISNGQTLANSASTVGVGLGQQTNTPTSQSAATATANTSFSTPELSVQASAELNAIVVRGTPAAISQISGLIGELDIRRPQVMIEAAIVEITGDDAEQLGVQIGLGGAAPLSGSAGASSFSSPGPSIASVLSLLGAPAGRVVSPDGFTFAAGKTDDYSLLIQALGQSTKANLLSTPSITTLDNEAAEIVVGQNVPFRTGSFSTAGNTTTPFTTIERQDVGITLKVTPRVHEGDVVRLEVAQEVSSLVNGNVLGAADLITNRRSIQTTVLADNGQTIVLGGLITDDRLSTNSRVPILGDIPVLGHLFRTSKEGQTKRTLFVFLRPTILRTPEDVARTANSQYSRLRAQEGVVEGDRVIVLQPPGARLPDEVNAVY